jgi:hypothetical protein
MAAKLSVVVVEYRVELVSSMNTAEIDHHHDFLVGFAEGGHHLMDILAEGIA